MEDPMQTPATAAIVKDRSKPKKPIDGVHTDSGGVPVSPPPKPPKLP